ncbi:D-alanyl-D-alanine carboxypeptidase family protein [Arthrobacter sp. I2-34]|uniref:D-alanyl-D-alanine carboxypeptidase family protein n=1 Tax=Arthrobacter hankyongi TaxID=2904801 RepID=A0ABS9L967_9MICC|nr:D-alanyl-D-alanine carboxypeptidase family protein [Arthrobacter hankyongi]MCG2623220.1 D-alanyl-D-alanine carboxypeptidase family protein [Arthrobacter hankyongi]
MNAKTNALPCRPPRSRWRNLLATAAVLCLSAGVLSAVPAPAAQAAEPVRDAGSIKVFVNKSHPLSPLKYKPADLATVKGTGYSLRKEAAGKLAGLFSGARKAGHRLKVVSAYRSYGQQSSLYSSYVRTYGRAYADSISARPGYSEHQTGLAVDVGQATATCWLEACFGSTPEGRWVAKNAYKYGFIVRYPKGQQQVTGYTYEPWHLRYVGVTLASVLRTRGIPTLEHYYTVGKPSLRGTADLLATDPAGDLWRYPGGTGKLRPRVRIDTTGYNTVQAGFALDWNRDGTLDLLLQLKDGRLLANYGKAGGGFRSPVQVGAGFRGMSLAAGRWVGTHKYPGVVARTAGGTLRYFRNASGKAVSAGTRIATGFAGARLTMADWDRDGRQDLLAIRGGALYVQRGDGAGRFAGAARKVGSRGWNDVAGLTPLRGYAGRGSTGLMAMFKDGRLRYYPYSQARLGSGSTEATGFRNRTVFG